MKLIRLNGILFIFMFWWGCERLSQRLVNAREECGLDGVDTNDSGLCFANVFAACMYFVYLAVAVCGMISSFTHGRYRYVFFMGCLTIYGINRMTMLSADSSSACDKNANENADITCDADGFGAWFYGCAAFSAFLGFLMVFNQNRWHWAMGYFYIFLAFVSASLMSTEGGLARQYCAEYDEKSGHVRTEYKTYCVAYGFSALFYAFGVVVSFIFGLVIICRRWPLNFPHDSWRAFYWFFFMYSAAYGIGLAGQAVVYCDVFEAESSSAVSYQDMCEASEAGSFFCLLCSIVCILGIFITEFKLKKFDFATTFLIIALIYLGYTSEAAGEAASDCDKKDNTDDDSIDVECKGHKAMTVFFGFAALTMLIGFILAFCEWRHQEGTGVDHENDLQTNLTEGPRNGYTRKAYQPKAGSMV